MTTSWFFPRRYKHLDVPVGRSFAERVLDPIFVAQHSFLPLIAYDKPERCYRPSLHKTIVKKRPIMYASHRDACILSYYGWQLNRKLESEYLRREIDANVIAYRKLGKGNYHFAAEALQFAKSNSPCTIVALDVRGFFNHLDHSLLKARLKSILGEPALTADWYAVFRHVTRFSKISRDEIKANPVLGAHLVDKRRRIICTIDQLKAAGIKIYSNPNRFGIPQGTPISSTLANLHMIDFDQKISAYCKAVGSLYRRYSDDLIFICRANDAMDIEAFVENAIKDEKLEINSDKTERTAFNDSSREAAQYLGFHLSAMSATIRPSSLARQWRKLKHAVRRTKRVGSKAVAEGRASKVFTRKLWKRFGAMPVSVRNFSSYARRSADILDAPQIRQQVRRLERKLDTLLKGL